MKLLEKRLLNEFQRDFPLTPAPFASIAAQLGTDSRTVLTTLKQLRARGAVSRIGPVFRPNVIGASTLATMAVPPGKLEKVAAVVNCYQEVNHNYEREHRFNLWFVVTAASQSRLKQTLADIGHDTGYIVLSLPLVKDYHIDLGFPMNLDQEIEKQNSNHWEDKHLSADVCIESSVSSDERLIEAIQLGLPLVDRPYAEVARRIGVSEGEVIDCIRNMQTRGIIKRFGVVVRHRELGYQANAMVVWDVPDTATDDMGQKLSKLECVTLCYRRPRRLPYWRYNLFCMIHGKDRETVRSQADEAAIACDLTEVPREILFSGRCFKQRGGRYVDSKGVAA